MNILVLSDKLHPTPNANGICLINIIREMERLGHTIWNVDRVESPDMEKRNERNICFFSELILSWIACTSMKDRFVYIIKRLFGFFSYPRYDRSIVKRYVTECLSFKEINKIDIIICICNPIETVEAALTIKKIYPSKKVIIYNLDTVSGIPLPKLEKKFEKYFKSKAYRWETRTFSIADLIVNLKCHKKHFTSKKYKFISDKLLFQDVPLLIKQSKKISVCQKDNTNIQLIYAGAFYKQLREPNVLLSLFEHILIEDNNDYSLLILTSSGYCREIASMTKCSRICTHEYISGDAFDEIMANSDILVSLGNKDSIMFPSKIVSYIALGKPIIHLYQDEKDSVIEYLANYPDKLLVDYRNGVNINKRLIMDYLHQSHSSIDMNKLYELYRESTPDFNASQILKRLEGC